MRNKPCSNPRVETLYSVAFVAFDIDSRVRGVEAENNPYLNEDCTTEHFKILAGALRWGYSFCCGEIGTLFHHVEDATSFLRSVRTTRREDLPEDGKFVLVKHEYSAGVVEKSHFVVEPPQEAGG